MRVTTSEDERFMAEAMAEAARAEGEGEVPVGCVLVHEGMIVGRGRNLRELTQDPSAHAEIMALRAAAVRLRRWRMPELSCYVTLEPCPMCAGALLHARIARVVYGCDDPKAGALRTLYTLGQDPRLNHRFEVTAGVLGDACSQQLSAFFTRLRERKR